MSTMRTSTMRILLNMRCKPSEDCGTTSYSNQSSVKFLYRSSNNNNNKINNVSRNKTNDNISNNKSSNNISDNNNINNNYNTNNNNNNITMIMSVIL